MKTCCNILLFAAGAVVTLALLFLALWLDWQWTFGEILMRRMPFMLGPPPCLEDISNFSYLGIFLLWYAVVAAAVAVCFQAMLQSVTRARALLDGFLSSFTLFSVLFIACWFLPRSNHWLCMVLAVPWQAPLLLSLDRCRARTMRWRSLGIALLVLIVAWCASLLLTNVWSKGPVREDATNAMIKEIEEFGDNVRATYPEATNTWNIQTICICSLDKARDDESLPQQLPANDDIRRYVEAHGYQVVTNAPLTERVAGEKYLRCTPQLDVARTYVIAPGLIACETGTQISAIHGIGAWRVYVCVGKHLILVFELQTWVS